MRGRLKSLSWQGFLHRPAVAAVVQTMTIAIVACAGIAVLGAVVQGLMLDELRRSLGQIATSTAAVIDPATHNRLVRSNRADTHEYTAAVKPLRVLRDTNPDIAFAYTGIIRNSQMFYVLDADPKDIVGSLLEADLEPPLPDEQRAWDQQSLVVESEPSKTRWGLGLRAYAPIRDSAGQRIAYVGLTMRAERYSDALGALRWAMFSGMGVSFLLASLSGMGVWRLQRERNRALQAAVAASESKSQFLANMSHEIRTPLNGVIGAVDLLRRSELNAAQRKLLGTAGESAHSLLNLVNDILDLSKIEAGRVQLESTSFDLHRLLESTVNVVSTRALAKGLDMTQYVDAPVNRWVRGDNTRLQQILLNLLSNAIKFTEHGAIHLRVSQQSLDRGQVLLRFEIRDSGIGIEPAAQARLFKSFTQADETTTRRFGGTGLGLFIARELALMMQGDIGCRSELGEGSTFWFTAILQAGEAPMESTAPDIPLQASAEPLPTTVTTSADVPGPRLLLVEDNPVNCEVLIAMLDSLGISPAVVHDGQQAVAAAATGFDLVLMDCHMPVMDGFEATRQLRANTTLARNGQRLPILALTANAFTENRKLCELAGMDDFLTKPVTVERLAQALKRWVAIVEPSEPQLEALTTKGQDSR